MAQKTNDVSGSTTEDRVRAELMPWVGEPFGDSGPISAPDPVNVPMIRHWVDAIDDRNPVYLDEPAARAAGHAGRVAPPAMLQTWTMQRPLIEGIAERGGSAQPSRGANPISMLADEGFTGTLATNSELEFDRYLRPGDDLTSEGFLESVSEQKTTGLGRGYFVTWMTEYRDQTGASVGRQRFRVYKFAPGTAGEGGRAKRGGGAAGEAPGGDAAAAPRGEALPDFDLKVTATVIVAGALASRDFMPVHHDPEFARAQGAPDMFMNILTTNGYMGRYVSDWAGPAARLRRIAIRLGAPAVPGHTMRFSGRVTADEAEAGGRLQTVAVAATNPLGPHATGTVELFRPS